MNSRHLKTPLQRLRQRQPIGIGPTRKSVKRKRRKTLAEHIQAVHDLVWARDSACRACGGGRHFLSGGLSDEMNEQPSRAKTRGKPMEQRFNTRICLRLCYACHRDIHAGTMRITPMKPSKGFDGPIRVERGLVGKDRP